MSDPMAPDRILIACPGENISFICTHDNRQDTHWLPPEVTRQCLVTHEPGSSAPSYSPFMFTMVSDNTGSTVTTIQTTATVAMNGALVECLAGTSLNSPQVGNLTIRIIGE